jgi:hypothetical protein
METVAKKDTRSCKLYTIRYGKFQTTFVFETFRQEQAQKKHCEYSNIFCLPTVYNAINYCPTML